MSVDRALDIIDGLLEILDEADRRAEQKPKAAPKAAAKEERKYPEEEKQASSAFTVSKEVCFSADTDPEELEGKTVRITTDFEHLKIEWEKAELGPNDEKGAFLGQVGKVTESEDDGTLQIQWANFDTCWVPLTACSDAKGAPPSIPSIANSWLSGEPVEAKEEKTEASADGPLLKSVEDECVKEGATLRLTTNLSVLQKKWEEAELGPNDELSSLLGVVGQIMEIEEDDDTVQLKWENFDTAWIPVQACMDAKGAKPTLPGASVSWLS